ncbi:hypothetical protein CBW65_13035 [Tumebacillus avium]|uniref:Yip1 domain-containing protein n=1 Tax=Tumebacillus avium TaxID=1903704 RepID=A0A1Y0INM0_9BACL|nr:hypothetical protein [Tumebacillus avium]ARU61850.1 hypothetical protein CBW65_13035 [Tumebacillus avium]
MNVRSALYKILFRPAATLDDLLFEGDQKRSWRATNVLAITDTLLVLVFLAGMAILYLAGSGIATVPYSEIFPISKTLLITILVASVPLSFLCSWVFHALARYCFAWIVRTGLRISAWGQYPRDRQEQAEKARQLQLIQPYTAWVNWMPSQLSNLLYGVSMFVGAFVAMTGNTALTVIWSIVSIVLGLISYMVPLGSYIYMIIVRVMAIQKIYGISGARAFWGPFLIYVLIYGVLFVSFLGILAWEFMTGTSTA